MPKPSGRGNKVENKAVKVLKGRSLQRELERRPFGNLSVKQGAMGSQSTNVAMQQIVRRS